MSAFATPTPMIEPIKVWDEDAGKPNHQVPKFQIIAAINRANTIANPDDEPTCKINSTGSKEIIPKATSPLENKTPRKLKKPDHTTATFGCIELV